MVDSNCGILLSTVKFDPGEWCSFNTQAPNITDRLLPGIASKDQEVRLREYDGMSISSSRG